MSRITFYFISEGETRLITGLSVALAGLSATLMQPFIAKLFGGLLALIITYTIGNMTRNDIQTDRKQAIEKEL